MRYLDRLINFIFSLVILVLAIVVIMVSAGFVGYDNVDSWIRLNIFSTANNTTTCIVAIVTLIAALKTTVFLSRMNPKRKNTILVDTNHGKVQIAAETIENTAKTVVKDYVEIKDGAVYINGEKLQEDYLQAGVVTDMHQDAAHEGNFTGFTVPENCVFCLGDNRTGSRDCRSFGCIPLEKIEGKVLFRFWPLNKFGGI